MQRSARIICRLLALGSAGVAVAGTPPDELLFVNTQDVVISFDARGVVEGVELWVSRDAGRSWQRQDAPRWGRSSLLFSAPGEGRYDLYVRLIGPQPMPRPGRGTAPHRSLVIDTTPPIVQIRAVGPAPSGQPATLRIDCIVIEEHLRTGGIRLLYRTDATQPWRDTGLRPAAGGTLLWRPPQALGDHCDLRLIVTDAAGNRGSDLRTGVPIPHEQPGPQPAASQPARRPPQRPAPSQAGRDAEADAADPRIERLRRRARERIEAARYEQALALLKRARSLDPDDPETLATLGTLWLRMGKRDQARPLFERALRQQPDSTQALEGLALIAALQHDYPQARRHLLRLLEIKPDAAEMWLRLGDIEHRLGRRDAADRAWQRAAALAHESDIADRARRRLQLLARP